MKLISLIGAIIFKTESTHTTCKVYPVKYSRAVVKLLNTVDLTSLSSRTNSCSIRLNVTDMFINNIGKFDLSVRPSLQEVRIMLFQHCEAAFAKF